MSKSYYGEQFEGMIISGMAVLVILCCLGACTLMNTHTGKCNAATYTYCGEQVEEKH